MSLLRWWRTNCWLVFVLVTVGALNVPVWAEPFGRDQGIFAYIGQGVLRGMVPYRDAWDHKPPGIDFSYTLAFALFGVKMVSIHILETISIIFTVVVVYAIGTNLFNRTIAFAASLLYGIGSVFLFEWWDRGQAEMFMSLPMALSALFLAGKGCPSKKALGLSGFFAGAALFFKPTAAPFFVFVTIAAFCLALTTWDTGKEKSTKWSTLWPPMIVALGGAVSVSLLLLYLGLNGALDDFYSAVFTFNTYHIQTGANLAPEDIVVATLRFGERMSILSPAAVLGTILLLREKRWKSLGLSFGWLLSALIGVWMQGKFFSYHWSLALPPLALLAGVGVEGTWRATTRLVREFAFPARTKISAVTLLGVVVLASALSLRTDLYPKVARDWGYFFGRMSEAEYLSHFAHNIQGRDVYSFGAARDAAGYLRERTTEDDTVLVWGFQALINFLAQRNAPTRYAFSYPLTVEQPESVLRQEARDQFMGDLRARKPKYVVTVTNDINPVQTQDSKKLLESFPEFKAWLTKEYALEKDIADFHIYRRAPSS